MIGLSRYLEFSLIQRVNDFVLGYHYHLAFGIWSR